MDIIFKYPNKNDNNNSGGCVNTLVPYLDIMCMALTYRREHDNKSAVGL